MLSFGSEKLTEEVSPPNTSPLDSVVVVVELTIPLLVEGISTMLATSVVHTHVMFIVVIATFEWTSLRLWNKIPKSDFFVIIAVSVITVLFDLAIAVAAGVIISALVFAWKKSQRIQADSRIDNKVKT